MMVLRLMLLCMWLTSLLMPVILYLPDDILTIGPQTPPSQETSTKELSFQHVYNADTTYDQYH